MPGAFFGAGSLPQPVEGLEELRQVDGAEAQAGVSHIDAHTATGAGLAAQFHRTAFAVVLDGVAQQVDEDLLDPRAVGAHVQCTQRADPGHANAARAGLRFDHGQAVGQHLGQGHGLGRHRDLAGLDLRQVQDLVDQFQQVPAGLRDLVDAVLLVRRGRGCARVHQLRETQDGVERRAQFVAHVGQELGLGTVGGLGRQLGVAHRAVRLLQRALQVAVQAFLFGLGVFACGVVGADQQVADDGLGRVAQRRHRHHGGQPAAVLAQVGQFIDVFDAAPGLEDQRLEARRDGRGELDAHGARALHDLLRVGDVGRGDPVDHIVGAVAQHALGTDIEDLDHAQFVGGDAGKAGAVEHRLLQRAGLQQAAGRPYRGLPCHSAGRDVDKTCLRHGRHPVAGGLAQGLCTRWQPAPDQPMLGRRATIVCALPNIAGTQHPGPAPTRLHSQ
jgi:hypothetical protein